MQRSVNLHCPSSCESAAQRRRWAAGCCSSWGGCTSCLGIRAALQLVARGCCTWGKPGRQHWHLCLLPLKLLMGSVDYREMASCLLNNKKALIFLPTNVFTYYEWTLNTCWKGNIFLLVFLIHFAFIIQHSDVDHKGEKQCKLTKMVCKLSGVSIQNQFHI